MEGLSIVQLITMDKRLTSVFLTILRTGPITIC